MKNAGMRKAILVMLGEIFLTVSAAGCLALGENAESTELTIGMGIFGVGEIQQSMTVLDSYPNLELDGRRLYHANSKCKNSS